MSLANLYALSQNKSENYPKLIIQHLVHKTYCQPFRCRRHCIMAYISLKVSPITIYSQPPD